MLLQLPRRMWYDQGDDRALAVRGSRYLRAATTGRVLLLNFYHILVFLSLSLSLFFLSRSLSCKCRDRDWFILSLST